MKRAAKAGLVVETGISGNSDPSIDIFVGDLDKKFDGDFSEKATMIRGFARTGDEKAFKEATGYCVPVESNLRE